MGSHPLGVPALRLAAAPAPAAEAGSSLPRPCLPGAGAARRGAARGSTLWYTSEAEAAGGEAGPAGSEAAAGGTSRVAAAGLRPLRPSPAVDATARPLVAAEDGRGGGAVRAVAGGCATDED